LRKLSAFENDKDILPMRKRSGVKLNRNHGKCVHDKPMATTILSSLLVLLQMMCVVIVVAYLLTRSRFFTVVLDGHPTIKIQCLLILVFGALSVYGTVAGVEFLGAIINIRDLGPMLAGMLGGPVVGLGAGIIGAAYRFSLGGFTVYSC
jgi:sigma-B regulation protein RsbU (phosphoserine phosphatase)